MSKKLKRLMAIGLAGLVAACAQSAEEEFVVVEPETISVEPVQTGKY